MESARPTAPSSKFGGCPAGEKKSSIFSISNFSTTPTLTGCTCFVGASVGNHEGAGVGSADVGTTDGTGEKVGSAVGESVAMIPGAILSGVARVEARYEVEDIHEVTS